ncbi:hypothetical protein H9P43_007266 [Blastocladiella emersonii ATCC 22665]|nr:hypothetical protein H9P43_007266 [Blastocladiella emersonii ATCC 22665]
MLGLDLNPETLIKDATLNLTRDFEGFVVITDFDQAAQNAVEAVFLRGQRIGCRWHMDVAVDIRDSGQPGSLRNAARNFLRHVHEARTEEEFDRLWNQKPQDLDDRVYEYLTCTWHKRRRLWASWAIGTFFHAGSTTSSRVKGISGLMKSFGLNTNSRLVHVDDAVGLELVREANQVASMEQQLNLSDRTIPQPDDDYEDAGIDVAHATPKAKKARVSALPDVRNPPRKYGNKVGRPPKSPPRPASCPSDFAKQAKRKRPAKKDAASAQKRTRRGTAATSAAAVSGSAADPSTALASSAAAASTAAVRAPAASGANAEVHLTSAARALQALLRKEQ